MTRRLLVTRDSECLKPLRDLITRQKRRTLVLWALECGRESLNLFESLHPDDTRPREALRSAEEWAAGRIKMPLAKRAAETAHHAANDAGDDHIARAAARAIGHVVGTVHTPGHAIGVAMYQITALLFASPRGDWASVMENSCKLYCQRLLYWERHVDDEERDWAGFLLRDHPVITGER